MSRLLALLLLAASPLLSQPETELWSKDSAVIVGDLISGESHEENARAFVTATLLVRRTLQGAPQPGAVLTLSWSYSALGIQPLNETKTVTHGSGLWVLDRIGEVWQPKQLSSPFPGTMGGTVLPVPPGDIDSGFAYPPEASAETKFAWELAASLAAEAQEKGDALNPSHSPDGYEYGTTAEQTWFANRASALQSFAPASTAGVYQVLAASVLPNLQMIGVAGRLQQNDPSALVALESNFAALARTRYALGLASTLRPELLRADPAALAILGRLALSGTIFPDLERYTAQLLPSTHRIEALPYLMAMLESPRFEQRQTTVRALCELLPSLSEGSGDGRSLWNGPAMRSKCLSERPPVDDQEAEEVFAFWRAWWASTQPLLEREAGLLAVPSPERYRNGPSSRPVERAALTRQQWFVMCARHYGSWLHEPPEQRSAHSGLLLNPGLTQPDQDVLTAILALAYQGLRGTDEELRRAEIAARGEARPTDPVAVQAVRDTRVRLAYAGLQQIVERLSPQGATLLFAEMDRVRLPGHSSLDSENRNGRP